jgi:uncharacterized protein (DUF2132 family)
MTSDTPDTPDTAAPTAPEKQARNPLHGLTLETLLTELVTAYGWESLGQHINIRCFTSDPSIASSLKFLRKTPWAREKVEGLFLFMQREQRRGRLAPPPAAAPALIATPVAEGDASGPAKPVLRQP